MFRPGKKENKMNLYSTVVQKIKYEIKSKNYKINIYAKRKDVKKKCRHISEYIKIICLSVLHCPIMFGP